MCSVILSDKLLKGELFFQSVDLSRDHLQIYTNAEEISERGCCYQIQVNDASISYPLQEPLIVVHSWKSCVKKTKPMI